MHFRFSHDFQTKPSTYWNLFFDEAYNQDLYKRLPIKSRQIVSFTSENQGALIRRTQKLEPVVSIPSWAQSLIKDFSYLEHSTYFQDRSLMEVHIEPTYLKDRFYFVGLYTVSPIDDRRCRRIFQGEVKVSVPLLGSKVEKLIIDQFAALEPTTVKITEEWLAKK